ncbi:MAG: sigma-70 family RNA polymerase sigma factor [Planctomycetes bacterium]|nr:sigma-70 family RNA polymerase sigma factor [Planctomycetota bacterium]
MEAVDAQFLRWRTSGDLDALGAVYDAAAPGLLRMALHHVRHPAMAEDLVQTTFLAAIHHAARWDETRPLLGWLAGILANHAKWQQRREGRAIDAGRLHAAEPADPLALAAAAEFTAQCDAAIETLPAIYRPVLRLSLKHELQAAEIAHVLGRPAGTVRSQITRGLDLLRAALPTGVALGAFAVLLPARGLTAVRAEVLAAASPAASVTTATVAAGAATSLWVGSVTMKKVVVGIVLAIVVGWWVMPSAASHGTVPPGAPDSALAVASVRDESRVETTASAAVPERAVERAAGAEPVVWELTGRVVDADGRPASRAQVDMRIGFGSEEEVLPAVATDHEGRYRVDLHPLHEMPPIDRARGTVRAIATAAGHSEVDSEVELAHRVPRRCLRAELDFALSAGAVVVGRVLGRDGEPVDGAHVELRTGDGATVAAGPSEPDGRFRVVSPTAGRGFLEISHLASGRAAVSCDWRVRADTDIGDLVLGGEELLARVVFDNGEPAAGIALSVATDAKAAGVRRHVKTDAAGWVRIVPTAPTVHRVFAPVPGDRSYCDLVPGAVPPTFVLEGLRLLRFACFDSEERPLHSLDVAYAVWAPTNDVLAQPPAIGGPLPTEKPASRGAGRVPAVLVRTGSFVHVTVTSGGHGADVVVQAPVAPNVTDTRLVLRERHPDAGLRLRLSATDGGDVGAFCVRLEPRRLGDPVAHELDLSARDGAFEGAWQAGPYRLVVQPNGPLHGRWFARQSTEVELVANRITDAVVAVPVGGRLRVRFLLPPERSGPVRGWTLECPAAAAGGPGELRSLLKTIDDGWVAVSDEAPAGVPLLWQPMLPPGRHEVRITAEGYADLALGVDIRGRAVTDLDVHLQPR